MIWELKKLSSFLTERSGRIKFEEANKLGLKRIKKIDFSGNIHLAEETDTRTDMILVKKGDLVISGINASKGAIAIHELDEDVLATIHYSSYKFDSNLISIEFLKWFFKSPRFNELLKDQIPGGIKTELKPKHILPLQIKLPKLSKQNDLAAKLNKFSHNKLKLEHEIENQNHLSFKLQKSILEDALNGKLTKDFRDKDQTKEEAKSLLLKINQAKEQLVKEKKIKNEKNEVAADIKEYPYEIPKAWIWCKFFQLGIANPRNYVEDNKEISFFTMSAILAAYDTKIYSEKKIWREVKKSFTHVANGDVAIAKITPCFENGKAALFKDLINGVGAATTELHVLRPILVNPEYLLIFLKSPSYIKNGIPKMTGTAGQKRIPTEYFLNSLVPLPPLTEQNLIVRRVKDFMKSLHSIENEVKKTNILSINLSNSILKEVFSPSVF